MEFLGMTCPYCKIEFKEGDDIVVCNTCKLPHHRECWQVNKGCTTYECTGSIDNAENSNTKRFCTNCGAALDKTENFCPICGIQIGDTNNKKYNQEDPDLYAFIQSNQPYYISKFQKMQMTDSSASWNACSLFFPDFWLAYRKMYGAAAIYVCIDFIFLLIPVIGIFLSVALSIFMGSYGNYFYKQHIDKNLQTAKNMDEHNKAAYISAKGGTSPGAVVALLGICFVLGAVIGSNMYI